MVRKRNRKRDGETQTWVMTKDPELREEWEFRKRAGGIHKSPHGPGGSEAAKEGARKVRAYTLECPRCHGLVDWTMAKKACQQRIKKLRRKRTCADVSRRMLRTDGCASRYCTKRYKNSTYVDAQRKYAAMLSAGERMLVAWPETVDDKEVWRRPVETQQNVVAAVLERHEGVVVNRRK